MSTAEDRQQALAALPLRKHQCVERWESLVMEKEAEFHGNRGVHISAWNPRNTDAINTRRALEVTEKLKAWTIEWFAERDMMVECRDKDNCGFDLYLIPIDEEP